MKIEKRQTTITLDTEELSTIVNAMSVLDDLTIASEEENEADLLGKCGQEFTYGELCEVINVLEAIIDAKGEFTIIK